MRSSRSGMCWFRKLTGQHGFTLAELLVALAVGAIIMVGSIVVMRHVIMAAEENRNETMAIVQVQSVGFWVSNDIVQAQSVELGEPEGMGLTIEWTTWNGDKNLVEYEINQVEDELGRETWNLIRTNSVDTGSGYVVIGASIVGENLYPGSTKCYWAASAEGFIVLEVTAIVDQSEASSTYEIYPRALK